MRDGTTAWLIRSGRYYRRRESTRERFTSIAYYTLDGHRIQLAKATCPGCNDTIESRTCGDFRSRECTNRSSIPTDGSPSVIGMVA